MAWIGAIVVVLAVAFFVKLAYDAGWFGRLSPLTKCLLAAGFGSLLIAAGEWALRRIGRPAAVGLFGAGIGTLYLTAYATFRYYHLLDERGAFVLLASVAALGFAITLRGQLLTIGVLSVAGGYLTPVLLSEASSVPWALPMYLTMLLVVSLGLSGRLPVFRPMRYVALGGHGLIGLAWAIDEGLSHRGLALAFLAVSWAIVTAELIWVARKHESDVGNVAASLAFTSWFVTVGCWVLTRSSVDGRDWLGPFAAVVAMLNGVIAYAIGGGLAALRARPTGAPHMLAVTRWLEGGVLAAVAVALQFKGFGESIGWLAIGLAAVEAGRRLGSTGVTGYGLLVGLLALVRIAGFDRVSPDLAPAIWSAENLTITRWTVLALTAIIATHIASRRLLRMPDTDSRERVAAILCGVGTFGWFWLCALQCRELAITGGWLLGTAALLAAGALGDRHEVSPRQRYFEFGLVALVATSGKWLIGDAVLRRLSSTWSAADAWPILNWQMGLGAAIAATIGWAGHIFARRSRPRADEAPPQTVVATARGLLFIVGGCVALVGLSFEVDRGVLAWADANEIAPWSWRHLRQLILTLVWAFGALGVGLLAAALRRRESDDGSAEADLLSGFAWAVLMLCGFKWIAVDTLLWAIGDDSSLRIASWPLANAQMLVGTALVVMAALLVRAGMSSGIDARRLWLQPLANALPVGVSMVLLWGLSFEVERAIGRYEAAQPAAWSPTWPPMHSRMLWCTLLWAAGGMTMLLIGRLRSQRGLVLAGPLLMGGGAAAWLTLDTIGWRLGAGVAPARLVLNLQFLSGASLALLLTALAHLSRRNDAAGARLRETFMYPAGAALGLVAGIGLWLGSLEIDRLLAPELNRLERADMARHTALSIYWGLYGIGLVVVGFVRDARWCRYAGLALLGVTLAKVLVIDMAEVRYAYRVLSLLGVGLLFVGTSIAYSKLAPRLLAAQRGHGS